MEARTKSIDKFSHSRAKEFFKATTLLWGLPHTLVPSYDNMPGCSDFMSGSAEGYYNGTMTSKIWFLVTLSRLLSSKPLLNVYKRFIRFPWTKIDKRGSSRVVGHFLNILFHDLDPLSTKCCDALPKWHTPAQTITDPG